MKIIEEYLNLLYKDDDSRDAQELKEELREHLITSAKEFMEQGYDIYEAQRKAIEQFDDDDESSIEIRSIYTRKIDVKRERLKKLRSIRWKFVNILGWFLGAAFFTAYATYTPNDIVLPTWLKLSLIVSFSILIILSLLIFNTNRNIDRD